MTAGPHPRWGVTLVVVRPFPGDTESFEVRRDGELIGFLGRHTRRTKPHDWMREMSRGRLAHQVTQTVEVFSVHLTDGATGRRGRVVSLDESSLDDALGRLLRVIR